jgi:hypothetical protein
LIGGLLGSGGSSQSQSTQQTLDPRMQDAVYGANGLLSGAQDWYGQNRAGLNPQMLTGLNNQWNQHGASQQGFNQMQSLGIGLMGQGMAGNPFSGGYSGGTTFGSTGMAPNPQQYQPAQQSSGGMNPFSMPVAAPAAAPAPAQPVASAYDEWRRRQQAIEDSENGSA